MVRVSSPAPHHLLGAGLFCGIVMKTLDNMWLDRQTDRVLYYLDLKICKITKYRSFLSIPFQKGHRCYVYKHQVVFKNLDRDNPLRIYVHLPTWEVRSDYGNSSSIKDDPELQEKIKKIQEKCLKILLIS